MKRTKVLRQTGLLILLFMYTTYITKAQYTLTNDDVVVTDGVIQSCSYDFALTDIIIPETLDGQTVTGIKDVVYTSDGVFYNKGISSLVLPASLTFIGDQAFHSNSIATLDLSGCPVVTRIGTAAFSGNPLTTLDLSGCTVLTMIGRAAFSSYLGLSGFILPTPDYSSFKNWVDGNNNSYAAGAMVSDLTTSYRAVITYTLTDNDVVVTDGIIQSCSYGFALTDVIIPETLDGQTVTGIMDKDNYDGVFYNKGISSIALPASLTFIGDQAFHTNSLTMLDLSACTALTRIGIGAFYSNSLLSLDFSNCAALTSIEGWAFGANSLISLDLSACTTLLTIGSSAFQFNSLTNLDLSACTGLTSIGGNAFYSNHLTSLDLSNCTQLTYIGYTAFSSNDFTEFTLPTPNIDFTLFNYWYDEDNNEYAGGATVNNLSTNYTASLTGTLQATFTVLEGTDPVENASIEFGNYGIMTTDASGIATFTAIIPENDIAYMVTASGYQDTEGTVSVTNNDITEEIQLKTNVTGVDELAKTPLNVYPNPALDILTITQITGEKISSVEVYNLHGQKVLEKNLSGNQEIIKLDIKNLDQGYYILRCTMYDNRVFSRKIVKKQER